MSLRNYIDKLKRYFPFSKEEWINYIVVVVVLAVIYSWTDWGVKDFDINYGLKNLAIGVVLVAITVFVHHAGQRMMALKLGFRAEQKLWWYGLLIGLVLVVVSDGRIKFLAATGTMVHLLPIHRLGAFRYGPNLTSIAKIAMAGPVLNIFFSAVIKSLEWVGFISPTLGHSLFTLNIAFAAWNLVPIPPLDGAKIFFYSRLTYVFIFSSYASYAFMVYFLNIYSYIFALVIGVFAWLLYYLLYERKIT